MTASVLLPARLAERAELLRQALAGSAGVEPEAVRVLRAPYRLCPLGAHVDHQFGQVLALALEHALLLAYVSSATVQSATMQSATVQSATMQSATSSEMVLDSNDFPGRRRFDTRLPGAPAGDWADFARGAVHALAASGEVRVGIHGLVEGALAESGLSSSAAVGVAWLMALAEVNGIVLTPMELVRAQGRIEQGFLGLDNGLLDPAAVVFGQAGALVRIDTRDLAHESVSAPAASAGPTAATTPAGPTATFLAISSGQRAALIAGSAFNERVAECREAARLIAVRLAGASPGNAGHPRLGDLPRDALEAHGPELAPPLMRRVRHFLTETERVDQGLAAWARGDVTGFGDAMRASALSSIHDYETGSPAMIDLLDTLNAVPGVHGARFSGAGHRGCCVALVDRSQGEAIAEEALARYRRLRPELALASFALASDPGAGAGPL